MDIKKFEQLIKLLKDNNLSQIEYVNGDEKYKLVGLSATSFSYPQPGIMPNYFNSPQPAMQQQFSTSSNQENSVKPLKNTNSSPEIKVFELENTIKSPFVGTFYESASPGSEPFVKIGDRIRKGQTLCIVEAMKLMNEIEADREGVLVKCLVKNEEPVEFDQALFIIEPA